MYKIAAHDGVELTTELGVLGDDDDDAEARAEVVSGGTQSAPARPPRFTLGDDEEGAGRKWEQGGVEVTVLPSPK